MQSLADRRDAVCWELNSWLRLFAFIALALLTGCAETIELKPGETYELQPGEEIVVEPDGTIWKPPGVQLYDREYDDPFKDIETTEHRMRENDEHEDGARKRQPDTR